MSGEIPPVRLTREGSLAILCIERPPVNAIDRQVRAGLHAALDALQAEPAAAVVLYGAGRCFIAGADIGEFERPGVAAELSALADRLAALPMPVIAAMHGAALGGGLELALASDYRLALPGTRLGLPEVGLGLIPGAGGTQRLPRVIGLAPALERICSGEPIAAEAAEALGLVDAVLPGETPLAAARAYLQSQPALARRPIDPQPCPADAAACRAWQVRLARPGPAARELARQAVCAAAQLPLPAGLAREAELFEQARAGRESQAQRRLFFAERAIPRRLEAPAEGTVTCAAPTRAALPAWLVTALERLPAATPAVRLESAGTPCLQVVDAAGRQLATLRAAWPAPARVLELAPAPPAADALGALAVLARAARALLLPLPGPQCISPPLAAAVAVARQRLDGAALERDWAAFGGGVSLAAIAGVGAPAVAEAAAGAPASPGLLALLACWAEAGAGLIAAGAADAPLIDLLSVKALGFPVYRGGPMFYADAIGPSRLVAALDMHQAAGLAPAPALRQMAREGSVFYRDG